MPVAFRPNSLTRSRSRVVNRILIVGALAALLALAPAVGSATPPKAGDTAHHHDGLKHFDPRQKKDGWHAAHLHNGYHLAYRVKQGKITDAQVTKGRKVVPHTL